MASTKIRDEAERVLRDAGIKEPPVHVERVARRQGAQMRYEPFRGELSGVLFRENGRTIIGVNSLHPKTRQRFTIAHELGHLLLHDNHNLHVDKNFRVERRDLLSAQGIDLKEIQANGFAAELLMPTFMLNHDAFELSLDYESDEIVRRLADKYGVSLQAMIIRLTQLGLIEQAVDLSF